MSTYLITQEEASAYSDYIPIELLNQLNREYHRCLVCTDDDTEEVKAAVLWELKNVEDDTVPTEAEILSFFCADKESGQDILGVFDQEVKDIGAGGVVFEMAEPGSKETAALEEAGYSLKSSESMSIYVSVEQLRKVKQLNKKPLSLVRPLSDISSRQYKAGVMNCVYHKRYGLLDDLPFLSAARFDVDISCCVMMDGHMSGLFLVHEVKPGTYRPELLFSIEPDASLHMLNMMRYATSAVLENAEEGSVIQVKRYNQAVFKLAEKLFPGIKGDMVIKGHKKY